ncbi:Glu/Leu/Phe/Val dehydrogenase dimerization domain-containing protein [Streptomyces sp. NPDC002644]
MPHHLAGTVPLNVTGFEDVLYHEDPASGLRAVIAIHSTVLGPALGGTRCHPYPTVAAAMADVTALARTMTLKSALAGLDLGGGKAVIIASPEDLSPDRLREFGRFVESLDGRYVTACDVGTTSAHLDVVAEETGHLVGRPRESGGSGDSGDMTAFGVLQAMRAAAAHLWSSPDLSGRHVGIEGYGKVGRPLALRLLAAGARVSVFDTSPQACAEASDAGFTVQPDPDRLRAADLDLFAPCGMGHQLEAEAVGALSARVVCGAANVPLADPDTARALHDAGIVYVPDFLANAGGLIQVAGELSGFDDRRVTGRVSAIREVTADVLRLADKEHCTPLEAAQRLAAQRLATASAKAGRR